MHSKFKAKYCNVGPEMEDVPFQDVLIIILIYSVRGS